VNPIEVDARGLRCPLPVIRLAAAALDAPSGTRIIVLASDPAARHDIPAWCRMRGHELREMSEISQACDSSGTGAPPTEGTDRPYLRFVVLVRPQSSKADGSGSGSERSSLAM
jgi:tRNA 2-thiouridine synthesizing protein A